MNKKTRVAISGAAGFIGSHLLEHTLINTDWDIVALVKMDRAGDLNRIEDILTGENAQEDWSSRVEIVRHDLNDSLDTVHKHIGELDYIAHLAACSHVDYSISEPVEVFINNSRSTVNMLEYARVHQPNLKKFLYFSTDEVYGPAPDDYDFTEEDKLTPSNPYSAGKAAGEMIVTAYKVTYGLPTLITNTMNVFGERQDPEKLIPKCMKFLENGEPMTIHGTPGNIGRRHWLHARNAADATLFLLKNDIVGEKVHIVGDVEMNNLEMFEIIAKAMGKEELEVGKDYVFVDFHATRPGHDRRYAMSGKKLADLGWVAPVQFEDSLVKTVKWTMENKNWVK
jgi:dTDP-glucose 4,6-dehydratase